MKRRQATQTGGEKKENDWQGGRRSITDAVSMHINPAMQR